MTINLSIDEIKERIATTRLEADAYYKIASGYLALAKLPTTERSTGKVYRETSARFRQREQLCRVMLGELLEIIEIRKAGK